MHLDVCFYVENLCAGRIGLGWAHDEFFFTRHMLMHCSCIHTFSFSYLLCWLCFSLSLSLSLSLSRILYTWHPSAKLLHPETLFISEHHLLILLLFLSGSMMRRPIRTSRRTSPNMAFIGTPRDSIELFQYCSTHYHSQSGLGISMWDTRELSLCDHIGVLLHYAWFWFFCASVYYLCSRYTWSSHFGAYLWCATCSEGIASWLP